MYKVIVVDDETWICKLIRKIVDWEGLDFHIISDAGDGLTALNLIKEHRPDLVITDIRMPSLDGIGLIKTTRELSIDTEFIIISGYSDFEYARNAVKYDAFGYIVKPLDKNELQEILLAVKEKINKKHQINTKIKLSESQQLATEIRKIIHSPSSTSSFEKLNQQFGTNFANGEFCAVVFKLDFLSKEQKENNDDSGLQHLLARVKEAMRGNFNEMVCYTDPIGSKSIFIINYLKGDSLKRGLLQALAAFLKEKNYSDQTDLTIGIGESVSDIGDVGKSYRTAMMAVNARMALGTGKVIDAKIDFSGAKGIKNIIDLRDEKKLSLYLEVFDLKSSSEEIACLLKKADKEMPNNPAACHNAALSIIEVLFKVMEHKQLRLESTTKEQAELYIENSLSRAKIESYLNRIIKEFAVAHSEARQEGNDKIIGEIKTYIMDNYMADIGLDDVAKLVCLNPTYVSEVFKKKTGENFIEYLSDYRITIAKELLQDIRYKIIDVSSMVGYKDSKYFSRLFKDVTGQNFSVYLQNLRISEACTLLKTTDKKVTEILSDVGFRDIKNFNRLFKKITGKTPGEYRKS